MSFSFLSDTVVSGGARLHIARRGQNGKNGARRAGQSAGGLLNPLIPLIHRAKNPLPASTSAGPSETVRGTTDNADRRQLLYLRLKEAESYEDWTAAVTELDTLEGNDAWKLEDESPEYDYALLKTRLEEIDNARISCDVKRMVYLIRTALTRDLGGMGDLRLYKHSHIGTKKLIERYNESVMQLLAALPDVAAKQGATCSLQLSFVLDELLRARQSYGRTALLLSGGGTFGMNHIGVVKCLWEQRLLPRIISGASAGSIVCAVLCTKSDAEIPAVLQEFCYGDLAVFDKVGQPESLFAKATRFLTQGALFDIAHLTRVMRTMLGDMTFQESYNRTHRVLNITVSSASMYELPRLLNYVTAPDVMIWSAVCASCSVPFVFSAASLMAKDRATGKEVPWNPTPNDGWIDGSVDNDLPMTRLAEMFNVNHFIVSQVNPHVVPFLVKEEEAIGAEAQQDASGPGWMQSLASFAKGEALHRLDMLVEMGVFPNAVTKARSVLSQRYSGDITIFPAISYTNFPKVLTNPTTEYMLQCLLTGEQATWPKLSRIRNHVAVELALYDSINKMRPHVHFSQPQVERRLENFTQSGEASRARRLHKAAPFVSHTANPTPTVELSSPIFPRFSAPCIQVPPLSSTKPHLPSHCSRNAARALDFSKPQVKVDVTSSTDPEGSSSGEDFSSNDESDTTDFLSSPSPPHSPPSHMPELWPSTRQIVFPSVSTPATPSAPFATFGHRNSSFMNLSMTSSAAPSSPELRYKRLFHPPGPTPIPGSPHISSDLQDDIKNSLDPFAHMLPLQQTETYPEDDHPISKLTKTDSLDEQRVRTFNHPPFTPVSSPPATRDGANPSKSNLGQQQQTELAEADRQLTQGRRGSTPLAFDYSGTRGMMLRKKRSRSNGFAN
ncbi:patatin-domain-containing protein [Massarina eburnea CBS 473.64]|uniref:Patatin-domain-containing protein n=1 Tax=Massarina eburnea CBS 473.64 TaxID=1395130 RepID=A0A6A6S9D2_9PLEO|nr:patatin-domain-containing protein [Massarina eburnea CBS 473.64]